MSTLQYSTIFLYGSHVRKGLNNIGDGISSKFPTAMSNASFLTLTFVRVIILFFSSRQITVPPLLGLTVLCHPGPNAS